MSYLGEIKKHRDEIDPAFVAARFHPLILRQLNNAQVAATVDSEHGRVAFRDSLIAVAAYALAALDERAEPLPTEE